MLVKSASFVKSSSKLAECPANSVWEFAFIGRSNVGKSSLINMLTSRKSLAKTSNTPGKTQLINHFLINENWLLVDLPGYGFAKVAKKVRNKFDHMIHNYLAKRESLACTFVLLDIRHEPQHKDLAFMELLGEKQIPFCMVFTKADKLSDKKLSTNIENYKNKMLENWAYLPEIFVTSSAKKTGRAEILSYIGQVIEDLGNPKFTNQ